jgi:hypothetical protein
MTGLSTGRVEERFGFEETNNTGARSIRPTQGSGR